jgi:hypothetical protein
LPDPNGKVSLLRISLGKEFLGIVASTPTLNSELDFVDVFLNDFVVFGLTKSFDFVLDGLCDERLFLLSSDRFVLELARKILFHLLANFLFGRRFNLCQFTCLIRVLRPTLVTTLEAPLVSNPPAASEAVLSLPLDLELLLFEKFILILCNVFKKDITVGKEYFVLVCQVTCHEWQQIFVNHHYSVKRALTNL